MTRHDRLALLTFVGITAWVVAWRSVVWVIDRVEIRLDQIAGDET